MRNFSSLSKVDIKCSILLMVLFFLCLCNPIQKVSAQSEGNTITVTYVNKTNRLPQIAYVYTDGIFSVVVNNIPTKCECRGDDSVTAVIEYVPFENANIQTVDIYLGTCSNPKEGYVYRDYLGVGGDQLREVYALDTVGVYFTVSE